MTQYLNSTIFDVVELSFIGDYYQYKKALKISDAINKSKHRPFFILGSHGPSPEPEYFLNKTEADTVVIGEGEETIIELLNALGNRKSLSSIKGIAYKDGDKVAINEFFLLLCSSLEHD